MQNMNISREVLLNTIDKEQVAFKFGDGLITFTNVDGAPYDTDLEINQDIVTEIAEMKAQVKAAKSLKVVQPQTMIDDENPLGFNELVEWSHPEDILVEVDSNLLLCLPSCTAKIIVEA